jgi:ABC-type phosphate transport system substrate-binding protein
MKEFSSVVPRSTKAAIVAAAILAVATAAWLTGCFRPVHAGGDPIVVIVNSANPVDNLSLGELKKLFLSDRSRWDTGKAVAPVMPGPGAPERIAFLKIVCGMNDDDMGKYFMQAAFTGKSATPPKEVGSSSALKAFVASSPGAIGFVKVSDFHGDAGDGAVKAVKIDGSASGDSGYKIKM